VRRKEKTSLRKEENYGICHYSSGDGSDDNNDE